MLEFIGDLLVSLVVGLVPAAAVGVAVGWLLKRRDPDTPTDEIATALLALASAGGAYLGVVVALMIWGG